MADKYVSQRTIVSIARVFELFVNRPLNYGEILYENDFPDWFVSQASQRHDWNWPHLLIDLRRGSFFFVPQFGGGLDISIVSGHQSLSHSDAKVFGEYFIENLAAFATTLPGSDQLLRSLELDGFDVDKTKLRLVPLEGPVSAQAEEDRMTRFVKNSGLPQSTTALRHVNDAQSLYGEGKDHSSLNESRSFIQALIDDISAETSAHGKHSVSMPGGTANRIEYLRKVGFLTPGEEAAFKSSWGSLSAGSHPGVPEREQARIGLILALEFGQLLMLKFANWKANSYQCFS
jgi:hypothetical protein